MAQELALSLGETILVLRKRLGLSLQQLAEKSGIPESTLSRYERGRTRPDSDAISRLARSLKTTPNALLDFPDDTATASQLSRKELVGAAA